MIANIVPLVSIHDAYTTRLPAPRNINDSGDGELWHIFLFLMIHFGHFQARKVLKMGLAMRVFAYCNPFVPSILKLVAKVHFLIDKNPN